MLTINSRPHITHAYKTRGSIPSRPPPHVYLTPYTHIPDPISLTFKVHHESKTPCTDAGDSGAGERMGRKYLDGICETNWDREMNTPICLEKKSLDWAENIWQHLEKVYLPWVKKVALGSILEKEKSFHFWIPWFCEPHNYGSYTHDSWTKHLILLLCPFFTPPQGDQGQTCHPHQQPHLFSSKDPFNLTSFEDFFSPHQIHLNVSSYLLHFPKLP